MIGILYSCQECGIKDAEVQVRFRESEEDVLAWMKQVVEPALGADHFVHSPDCHPESLQNVKIPVPAGTQFLGGMICH